MDNSELAEVFGNAGVFGPQVGQDGMMMCMSGIFTAILYGACIIGAAILLHSVIHALIHGLLVRRKSDR